MLIHDRDTELGGHYLGTELRDTPPDAGNREIRDRLRTDGYVLLRGLLDRDQVLDARRAVLEPLAKHFDPGFPVIDGVARAGDEGQHYPITVKPPELVELATCPALTSLFARILGGPVTTYDHKWVRAYGPGTSTNFHWDAIFWDRGTVYSGWVPLGDVPLELGPLALVVGASGYESLIDAAPRGVHTAYDYWDTLDPFEFMDRFGGRLETSEFRAGDVVAFPMTTAHTTLPNTTNRVRLSSDVRFQLQGDEVDPHYMGAVPPFKAIEAEIFARRSS